MPTITVANAETHQRIVDVLNNVFGCHYGAYMRGYWRPNEDADAVVWFPKMSATEAGRGDCSWVNRFVDDQRNEFTTRWNGAAADAAEAEQHARALANLNQIVFANIEGSVGYQFLGVYQCRVARNGVRHYVKIADSVDIGAYQHQ